MAEIQSNGTRSEGIAPKITLYTNHGCPYAHRAHIVLKELGLPYEEVIIDLMKPREEWYLKINPVEILFYFFLNMELPRATTSINFKVFGKT